MGNAPEPRSGAATTSIAIVAAVVVVLVGLGVLGFVGMIVAYAMLHAPPPHVGADATGNDVSGVDAAARAAPLGDVGLDASAHGTDDGGE